MRNNSKSNNIKKVLLLILFISLTLNCSCVNNNDNPINPKLKYRAFEIIGTDGLKKGITLNELQGEYAGDFRFMDLDENIDLEMKCLGSIKGSRLILELVVDENNLILDEIPAFILDEGIITAPEIKGEYLPQEDDLTMICGVKVYPSGHMISGVLKYILAGEEEFSKIMFRITNKS